MGNKKKLSMLSDAAFKQTFPADPQQPQHAIL
jgi:hypothetical protein